MAALRKVSSHSGARGFTLMEVVFAVLILSSSLVTLLGLQSSSLQLAAHDKYTQKAMLIAREILAPIETSREPIDPQEIEGTPDEVLEKFLPARVASNDRPSARNSFRVRVKVDYWGIPKLNEQAMKRIVVGVHWSTAPLDSFEIVYFMPNEGDQTERPNEETE